MYPARYSDYNENDYDKSDYDKSDYDGNIAEKGLIIVEPYGTYIRTGEKTTIVKSRKISTIVDKDLLLIENKMAYGIIRLDTPQEINLAKFKKLYPQHVITEEDRQKWWPNYKILYEYKIIEANFFKKPLLINYSTGPQITVNPDNIIVKKIYVGTSGYNYRLMYPPNITSKNMLAYYQQHLNSVEINYTFYHIPTTNFVDNLAKYNLAYTIKVHKYITHSKQLKSVTQDWADFYSSLYSIYNQIACFLFQFSAKFIFNDQTFNRLKKLAKNLNPTHRYVFEFRHGSWFNNDEVIDLFAQHNWTIVIVHVADPINWAPTLTDGFNPKLSKYRLTSDTLYIRLHGSINQYHGSYSSKILTQIYNFIATKSIDFALIYFNNTDDLSAFKNAISLFNKFNKLNVD